MKVKKMTPKLFLSHLRKSPFQEDVVKKLESPGEPGYFSHLEEVFLPQVIQNVFRSTLPGK